MGSLHSALKLWCVINCKNFQLSDRISFGSAIKGGWEVNALHSYNNFLHKFGNKNNYTTGRQSWAHICQCWWCNEHHRWCRTCLDMVPLSFGILPRLHMFKNEAHDNAFPWILKHIIQPCKAKENVWAGSWHFLWRLNISPASRRETSGEKLVWKWYLSISNHEDYSHDSCCGKWLKAYRSTCKEMVTIK